MSNVRYLPTDRNGNIYYGPKTFAQAEELIEAQPKIERHDVALSVAENLEAAGYLRIAAKVRKEYGV